MCELNTISGAHTIYNSESHPSPKPLDIGIISQNQLTKLPKLRIPGGRKGQWVQFYITDTKYHVMI
jgi:hypothetical protein